MLNAINYFYIDNILIFWSIEQSSLVQCGEVNVNIFCVVSYVTTDMLSDLRPD